MLIAGLADAHGNGFAMEAVAGEIQAAQPDLIVNLGDQVWGQANPRLALEIQMSLGAVEVRGNNDERLLWPDDQVPADRLAVLHWLREQLPAIELERLAHLPKDALLADGELLVTHGTPGDPWDSLLWSWENFVYFSRPEVEVQERLQACPDARVVLVGHSHLEQQRNHRGRLLVNVGSVAHQTDGDPRARFAFLRKRGEQWSAELRKVEYDWTAAARWIIEHAPDAAEAVIHTSPPNCEKKWLSTE